MNRKETLEKLHGHLDALHREFGIKSLALFGSVAKNCAGPQSDVDLLVDFDRPVGLFHLLRTKEHLQNLLGVKKVDLVLRNAVIPELRENILMEAVNV